MKKWEEHFEALKKRNAKFHKESYDDTHYHLLNVFEKYCTFVMGKGVEGPAVVECFLEWVKSVLEKEQEQAAGDSTVAKHETIAEDLSPRKSEA